MFGLFDFSRSYIIDFQTGDQKIYPYHIWYLEKLKEPGLVKETLGKLGDLTPERLYIPSLLTRKSTKVCKNLATSNFFM